MRISDWSSDVALPILIDQCKADAGHAQFARAFGDEVAQRPNAVGGQPMRGPARETFGLITDRVQPLPNDRHRRRSLGGGSRGTIDDQHGRSEEHTSELQSLMRISYAVFCLKKNKQKNNNSKVPVNRCEK